MTLTQRIKEKIFSKKGAKAALVRAINGAANFDEAFNTLFFEYNEEQLQKTLAPFLRKSTLSHMHKATSSYMVAQREQFSVLAELGETWEYSTWDELLAGQQNGGVWGTNFDAAALADLLDLGVLLSVDGSEPYKLRDATNNIIFLAKTGIHWHLEDGYNATLGDGNCLYNAYSKILRRIILSENEINHTSTIKTKLTSKLDQNINVYKTQAELLGMIQKAPLLTNDELISMIKSQFKLSELADHKVAVEVARADTKCQKGTQSAGDLPLEKAISSGPQSYEGFEAHLKIMKLKARDLRRKAKLDEWNYGPARDASKILVDELSKYYNAFKKTEDYVTFNANCMVALSNASRCLDPYPDWKQILLNISAAIIGLGVIYAGAVIYNKFSTGRFLLFPPAFVENRDSLECVTNMHSIRGELNKMTPG
jgi:hypothetical protein